MEILFVVFQCPCFSNSVGIFSQSQSSLRQEDSRIPCPVKGFSSYFKFFWVEVDPWGSGLMELGFPWPQVSGLDQQVPNKVWALLEAFPGPGAFGRALSHVPFPASTSLAGLLLPGIQGFPSLQLSNWAYSQCFWGFLHLSWLRWTHGFPKLFLEGARWHPGMVQFLGKDWRNEFQAGPSWGRVMSLLK